MTSSQHFYQQLRNILEQQSVVIVTVVKTIGSSPREVGAKMAVCRDGSLMGTIGGGAGEGKVIEQALTISGSEKRLVEIDLTGASAKNSQGVCGGKVQVWLEQWEGGDAIALVKQILALFESGRSIQLVTPFASDRRPYLIDEYEQPDLGRDCFVETLQPPPTLLIVGGGHVSASLAQIASFAGFQVAIQDDRPEFVTAQRFPQALFLSQSMTDILERLAVCSRLYVALVTRGYFQDVEALQAILQRPLAYQYIGAIGSQKRIDKIRQALQQQGVPVNRLPNFYAPIGLDIGALTPQEIAVSICGELIKVRRGGTGLSLCERMQQSKTPSKVHTKGQMGERLHAKRQ